MKVLILGNGLSNHIIRWCNSLASRGHDVILVSRKDQADANNYISNKVTKIILKYNGGIGYYLSVPELRRIYKNYKPDIVNVQYIAGYGTLARLSHPKKLVASCYGSDVFDFPYKNKLNYRIICENLKAATRIASTSIAMAEQVRKIMKDTDLDVTVTPFGVDISRFSPKEKRNDKDIRIGIVKYLEPIYDIPLLIKAHAILCKRVNKNIYLDIYGDGSLLSTLKKLTADLGTEELVVFHGKIPNTEVPKVLNQFDIFVNCSLQESFGVAVVEAMACELPVVVTKTAGFTEIVDDKINGLVLPDRNPETMANTFEYLINNPNQRELLGKEARKKVVKQYNWENNVSIMENLFLSVVKE